MPKGGFKRTKTTGEWIRDHLLEAESDYVGRMSTKFRRWCKLNGYHPPSYDSFRRTVWLLKEVGLLEFDREGRAPRKKLSKRRYYRISGSFDHPGWRDPFREKYPNLR